MEVHFAEIQAGLITISAPLAAIAEQSGFTVKRLNTKKYRLLTSDKNLPVDKYDIIFKIRDKHSL